MANQNPTPQAGGVPLPKSKRGLRGFFAEVGREMKKVTWPTRQETTRLTGVVLVVCVATIALLYVLTTVFHTILQLLTRGF